MRAKRRASGSRGASLIAPQDRHTKRRPQGTATPPYPVASAPHCTAHTRPGVLAAAVNAQNSHAESVSHLRDFTVRKEGYCSSLLLKRSSMWGVQSFGSIL